MDIIKMTFLVDNCRGEYMGQSLARMYPGLIESEEDWEILLSGPDHPDYNDALDNVLYSELPNGGYITTSESGDFMLCSPDTEAESILYDLADAGNKVADEIMLGCDDMTIDELLEQISDYPYQTPECKDECDAIREALREALK